MQPPSNSREIQAMNANFNSLLTSSPINLHGLHPHFDPTNTGGGAAPTADDFFEQIMLSSTGIPSWPDLNPSSDPANHHHPIDSSAAAAMLLRQHLMLPNDVVVDGSSSSSFKPPASSQGGDSSVQSIYNGFAGSLALHNGSGPGSGQTPNATPHFHHPQGEGAGGIQAAPNFGAQLPAMAAASAASVSTGGASGGAAPAQPKQRVRARRGQATDPHSIAERLRRERIAERMKALQELVPNANKTDKASMLDEIIDYVKFLQLQVKVLSMSRLGGAAAVAPLVADMSSEGGAGDCIQAGSNGRTLGRNGGAAGNQTASSGDNLTVAEHQVAKLMEEDMGSAMQYLQGKGLCLMPISLATAISTATCHSRSNNPLGFNGSGNPHPALASNNNGGGADSPTSPSLSVLTVQSATAGNGGSNGGAEVSVKDVASVSKP